MWYPRLHPHWLGHLAAARWAGRNAQTRASCTERASSFAATAGPCGTCRMRQKQEPQHFLQRKLSQPCWNGELLGEL